MKTNESGSESIRISRRGFLWQTLQASALCAALICSTFSVSAAQRDVGGKKGIFVYTLNIYIGAEIAAALDVDPTKPEEVLPVTSAIYAQIVASRPEVRIATAARDIADRLPDVVSVEELYTFELAPMIDAAGTPGTFVTTYNYLDLLTQALANEGAHYKVAVVSQESQVMLPLMLMNTNGVFWGRLTDHEAILVRSDLPPGQLWYNNPQTGHFQYHIQLPGLDLIRGWCSIDAFVRGDRVRIIAAHLETEAVPQLQYAQAQELLAGPANTLLPVILMGDFNTDPLGRDGTATYPLFGQAGFTDSWLALNQANPAGGLTWGHDPLLANPADPFETRIDFVFYRGSVLTPLDVEVIDLETELTAAPLWASDHKAVAATFAIGNPRSIKMPMPKAQKMTVRGR